MPFTDADIAREYHRKLHNERYWTDAEFRAAEAKRKAEWYQRNKERCAARLAAWKAANPDKVKANKKAERERAKAKRRKPRNQSLTLAYAA